MPFVRGYKWTEKQRQECGFKKRSIPWNKGKINVYSEDWLKNMSLRLSGKPSYFKGKKHSKESIEKIKKAIEFHPNRKGPKGKPWSMARKIAQENRNNKPYKRGIFRKLVIRKPVIRKPVIKNGKEYSSDWHNIRKQIYKRDNWICQECGAHCHNDKKIQCHHIDYDISNNTFSNLITLCASCHAKSNYKREDWIKYYEKILWSRSLSASEN